MSVLAVAEKDFRDAVQSKALWVLVVLFVGLSSLMSYAYVEFTDLLVATGGAQGGESVEPTVGGLVFFTASVVGLFVSLTAVIVGYKAIAGERELGSAKLLLALPHSRSDVLLGKILGRTGVISVALAVGLVVGLGVGLALLGEFAVVPVVALLVLTLAFTGTYVAIIVSLSASTGSTTRATTLAVGFLLLFEFGWGIVSTVIVYVANGFSLPATLPDWYFLIAQLPPSAAYSTALTAVLPDAAETAGQSAGGDFEAFYATPELGFVILAFWLVVPLVIGYVRFSNADL